jgi:hypothetical protein
MFLDHALHVLLTAMPGFKLSRHGSSNASSILYDVTGVKSDKRLKSNTTIRDMYGVQVVSIHIDMKEYSLFRSLPKRVDFSLRHLASTLPKSRVFRALTVTPNTRFYTDDHFDHYAAIAKGQRNAEFIYLPPKSHDPTTNPGELSQVSAWIQKDEPPAFGVSPISRTPDLFLEIGTRISTAASLCGDLSVISGLSFIGGAGSSNSSISNLCRSLGLEKGALMTSLRVVNFDILQVHQLSSFGTLTTLDLHDIKKPEKFLGKAAGATAELRRFTISYSGFPDNGKQVEFKTKFAMSLRQIIRRNTKLEALCVQVKNIQGLTAAQLISELPPTLELLHFTYSGSDFFRAEHYKLLAEKCPLLRGVGTTMNYALSSDPGHSEQFSNIKCKQAITGLRSLAHLEYFTIVRFTGVEPHYPSDLASYLYGIAEDQNVDFGCIISVYLRQSSYRRSQQQPLGDHFMLNKLGIAVKFQPTIQNMVKDIMYLSASFGKTMADFAAAEGLRFQYNGPNDIETNVGRSWSSESLVRV